MVPELPPERHHVEFGNPDAVTVGGNVLRDHVHRDFCEEHVRADAGGGGDSRLGQNGLDEPHREFVRGQLVGFEVVRRVDEDLVDRVGENVLRRHEFQVNRVDFAADPHVLGHSRRRFYEVDFERGVFLQLREVVGFPGKFPALEQVLAALVRLVDALNCLEKARPSRNSERFQRRRDSEADSLLGAALVRNNKIRCERIPAARNALHRGVERLEIDRNIYSSAVVNHSSAAFSAAKRFV